MKGHWCFKHSNILGGCLAAPCVMWKFSISLWHWCFSQWALQCSGGNRLQRHANTRITDLRPCSKFMKCFQCPLLSWCHDHTISVWVILTTKGARKRFYSSFFLIYIFFILSLVLKSCSKWNNSIFVYIGVNNLFNECINYHKRIKQRWINN